MPELKTYIGHHVRITGDDKRTKVVEIEEILGSLKYPHMFQINAKGESYFISMLDFYAQMNGENVSEDDIKAFNETVFDIKKAPKFSSKKGGIWQ